MMWYYGGAGWFGWLIMGLSMVIFWGGVIFLVAWAFRASGRPAAAGPSATALAILQERLARGEITPEEFTERKELIENQR